MRRPLRTLHVRTAPGIRTRGVLIAGPLAIPVALGRGGILANKREGDGGTPRGRFRALRLWWRADRDIRPATLLPSRRIGPGDAWCEDPSDRRYNRPILIPASGPGDRLRRDGRSPVMVRKARATTIPAPAPPRTRGIIRLATRRADAVARRSHACRQDVGVGFDGHGFVGTEEAVEETGFD